METLMKWKEILKDKYGIENFSPNDRICILHFDESAIERTYKKYFKGGSFEEMEMKKPKLCYGACPTIFPSQITKGKADYAVKIVDQEILNEQRRIFAERRKEKLMKEKRKLESESTILEEAIVKKRMKVNNLYKKVVKCIVNGIKPFRNSRKSWIPSIDSENCIVWSLWNEDRSCLLKNIILYPDLKVKVLIESKEVILPETKNIIEIDDLDNLFNKVERLTRYRKVNDNTISGQNFSHYSHNDCSSFVVLRQSPTNPEDHEQH
ncbi:uncharacterized protein LOC122501483 isoform X2 [Leptopilina heterotoma]|nr:uncharacterized protein LOC122501483 isoform X2 [Leptopilina heterotoma]